MASVTKRKWTYNGVEKTAWIVRYVDGKGVRRGKTFELKKQADAYRRKVDDEIDKGTHAPESTATVQHVAMQYLRHLEIRRREGKIGRGYYDHARTIVEKRIIPALGKHKMTALDFRPIEEWHRTLVQDGMRPSTIRQHMSILRRVEHFAVVRKLAHKSVVSIVTRELGTAPVEPIRTFTIEEIHRILRTAEGRSPRGRRRAQKMMKMFVHIAAFCGLRLGEIRGLTWPCIDLDNRIIAVRHNLTRHDELKGPKTKAGNREVPIPLHVVEMLGDWRANGYMENERQLLFRVPGHATREEREFTMHTFWQCWVSLLLRAGFQPDRSGRKGQWPHFHALRHFCASWWVDNGAPLPEVAHLLGHAKVDLTLQIYTHAIRSSSRRDLMDRMSASLMAVAAQPPIIEPELLPEPQRAA